MDSTRLSSPKRGARPEESAIKELAAFMLDRKHYAGVPRTAAVMMTEQRTLPAQSRGKLRMGSLQEFQHHLCSAEDVGSSKFLADEVHLVGLLDVRLCNLDRHLGNLLVRPLRTPIPPSSSNSGQGPRIPKDEILALIPIDHGYVLPSFECLSDVWFCWTVWKQAKEPFSERIKNYVLHTLWDPLEVVSSLPLMLEEPDAIESKMLLKARDLVDLEMIGIGNESIMTYLVCSIFEREMMEAGRTLFDMAITMQRSVTDIDEPCELELLIQAAKTESSFGNINDYMSDDESDDDDEDSGANEPYRIYQKWSHPKILAFLMCFSTITRTRLANGAL
jgi:hypothetical protein